MNNLIAKKIKHTIAQENINELEKDLIACEEVNSSEEVKACNCGSNCDGNCACNNGTAKEECACNENVEEKSKITAKNNIILQRLAKPTVYKLTRIY